MKILKIKIVSCKVISEMWYSDFINSEYKVKQVFENYYTLFFSQRIIFKDDAIIIN